MRSCSISRTACWAGCLGALAIALSAGGCGGPGKVADLRVRTLSSRPGRSVSIDAARHSIIANSASIVTLTADVRAVIASRAMSPSQLAVEGKLAIMKHGKVVLTLGRMGSPAIKLTGDGLNYETRMPMLSNLTYGGHYGQPLDTSGRRVSFVAEDVADALDMSLLFQGTRQVLRTYPQLWPVHLRDPAEAKRERSVAFLDCVLDIGETDPVIKVISSIAMDTRNGRVIALDKFRGDGSLRRRTWFRRWTPVTGPDMSSDDPVNERVTVDVPCDIIIHYPSPLEGTVVRMKLSKIVLNPPVNEQVFELKIGGE